MTVFGFFLTVLAILAVIAVGFSLFSWYLDSWGEEEKLTRTVLFGYLATVLVVIGYLCWKADHTPNPPFTGTAIYKAYHPMSVSTVLVGKVPVTTVNPAHWSVDVKKSSGEERACDVSEQTFGQLQLGDEFTCQ